MGRFKKTFSRSGRKHPPRRKAKEDRPALGSRRLACEPLEDRRMLAVLTVSNIVDELDTNFGPGDFSLREAIQEADPGDTINFSVTGTIALLPNIGPPLGELVIDKNLTIQGPGASQLTIRAYDATPFSTPVDNDNTNDGDGGRIFDISAGSPASILVTIRGLTLTGGDLNDGTGGGAAIRVTSQSLTLDDMVIEGNSSDAFSSSGSGAIYAQMWSGATLTIADSILRENYATGEDGGAIYAEVTNGGSVVVSNSRIEDNRAAGSGGGIAVRSIGAGSGSFLLQESVVADNEAGFDGFDHGFTGGGAGGGIHLEGLGEVIVERNYIWHNFADGSGGGFYVKTGDDGIVEIRDSTIYDNTSRGDGGGVHIENTHDGAAAIVNSTISDNRGLNGGGIYFQDSAVHVRHSTIANNEAGPFGSDEGITGGGGVLIYTNVSSEPGSFVPTFDHCIIAGNIHIQNEPGANNDHNFTPEVGFLLLAGGTWWPSHFFDMMTDESQLSATFNYTIVQDPSGPLVDPLDDPGETLVTPIGPNEMLGVDPQLEPLANNGGFLLPDGTRIKTHALASTSPAVDSGDPSLAEGVDPTPERDERGAEDGFIYERIADWPLNNTPGNNRPRIDIGAFELQFVEPINGDADFNQNSVVEGGDFLIWQKGVGLTGLGTDSNDFGDADLDRDVDGNDLFIWRQQYGQVIGNAADFNNDTAVDGNDYAIWQENNGTASGASQSDGDADGDGDVDEDDFLAWQIVYSIDSGLLDWMVHTLDFAQLAELEENQILVSTLVDEDDGDYSLGDLSLREALAIAADIGGGHEIFFANHLAGTILLGGSVLAITSDVTIHGPGVDRLTIDAQRDSGVFSVAEDVDATITGLKITGGGNVIEGAGIFNAGRLTLDHVEVIDNLTAYTVYTDTQGGGIVTRNPGSRTDASLWMTNSTVSLNRARAGGGLEINLGATGVLVIDASTISDNTAIDGQNLGAGGGLRFLGASTATGTIKNTTISGNHAINSGGLRVWSSSAPLKIVNATIADNTGDGGGGIHEASSPGTITVHNSIVANNQTNASVANDIGGGLVATSSYNLLEAGAGTVILTGANNQTGVDPKLEPLADNGGPTWTHKLMHDSPALDAASFNIAAANLLISDQRGRSRYVFLPGSGQVVDRGAYEYNLIVTVPDDPTTNGYARNDLSLREALAQAAAINPTGGVGPLAIEFAPEVYDGTLGSGVFTLSGNHLSVSSPIDIVGPGADVLTLNAASGKTVFAVSNNNVSTLIDVAIRGLTIDGDNVGSTADGGAIYSVENLTLDSVVVTGGQARSGGGLYQQGSGSVTIVDSTFTGNTAYWGGGAVVDDVDDVLIASSTFHGNDAIKWMNPGWVAGSGSAAGLHLLNIGVSNPADIVNSTFSGNDAEHDGGAMVLSAAYAVLLNDTIVLNTAAGTSGAFGGIHLLNSNLTLHSTILAKNILSGGASDIGLLTSTVNSASSYNLLGLAGGSGLTNGVNGNQVGTGTPLDPLLEELADNGGPTRTHKLENSSPAIDAGGHEHALDFVFDQREWLRFDDGDSDGFVAVDIGAFERALEMP